MVVKQMQNIHSEKIVDLGLLTAIPCTIKIKTSVIVSINRICNAVGYVFRLILHEVVDRISTLAVSVSIIHIGKQRDAEGLER